MLLNHLYRISLEKPDRWGMFIGIPSNTMSLLEVRVDQLKSYIQGFRESSRLAGIDDSEGDAFFEWLIKDKQEFPCEGWATKSLNDCFGDHLKAISKFWGFLHEYLLMEKPDWLVKLNTEPLRSQIMNGVGQTRDIDIRNPDHVRALVSQ